MNIPAFSTFGCRLNAFETEAMKKMASDAGLENAIVVNTCAVTSEAVRKSRREIRRLRRDNPDARIIATGCAAQIDPGGFAGMNEVDFVIGNNEKMKPETWRGLAGEASEAPDACLVDDIMLVAESPGRPIDGFGTRSRAYVQIQNGCDHRCTFCIIPYGRGNSRSVPADAVVEQVVRLVDRGFREVVLTGVDITSWGGDMPEHPRLGDLVLRILKSVPSLERLRISSIDSIEVDDALMRAIAEESRLMPHLHLSLQHGDDLILKRMKRRHLRGDAIRFAEKVRGLRPDIVFGADIIAGFPTETEEQFSNSVSLVEECGLTWLHVFPYSPRPGTPAARMPQVDGLLIRERAERLRSRGSSQVERYLAEQIGKTHNVLMESPHMGRTEQFAEVICKNEQKTGSIIKTVASDHDGQRLLAA
ncbi:MAG: tRNA (N(6)-L-threonylcarbamoyladenosine(37)-C(2))-methylthiotransferase MtaB [Roseovarius sp.]|nr:tRNA (N(6)-L-threonylcarbamoyladenosine(37)-C(2))-methylthiotransferase MtaB [Roseovarius sp.]